MYSTRILERSIMFTNGKSVDSGPIGNNISQNRITVKKVSSEIDGNLIRRLRCHLYLRFLRLKSARGQIGWILRSWSVKRQWSALPDGSTIITNWFVGLVKVALVVCGLTTVIEVRMFRGRFSTRTKRSYYAIDENRWFVFRIHDSERWFHLSRASSRWRKYSMAKILNYSTSTRQSPWNLPYFG